jgi:hypothetical protein
MYAKTDTVSQPHIAERKNYRIPNYKTSIYQMLKVTERQKLTSAKNTHCGRVVRRLERLRHYWFIPNVDTAAYMKGLYNTVRVLGSVRCVWWTTAIRNMPPQLFYKSTSLDVTLVWGQSDIFLHCPALLCDFIICTLGKIK